MLKKALILLILQGLTPQTDPESPVSGQALVTVTPDGGSEEPDFILLDTKVTPDMNPEAKLWVCYRDEGRKSQRTSRGEEAGDSDPTNTSESIFPKLNSNSNPSWNNTS